MAADGFYQMTISGFWVPRGDRFQNVLSYSVTGTSGSYDAYAVARAINTAWLAEGAKEAYLACLAESVYVESIKTVRKHPTSGGVPAIDMIAAPGEVAEECDTIATGAQIQWIGIDDDGGPDVPIAQGWTTLPGIPADSYVEGIWTVAYNNLVVAFIAAQIAELPLATVSGVAAPSLARVDGANQIIRAGNLKPRPGVLNRRLDRRY